MNFAVKKYQKLDEIMRDVCTDVQAFDVKFIYDNDETILQRIKELEGINKMTYPAVIMTGWSESEEDVHTLTVTIDQLWLIHMTNKEEFSEFRSEQRFEKFLLPLQNELEYRLKSNEFVWFKDANIDSLKYASRRREMLAGTGENLQEFSSPVDAIVYEGLQLKLIKKKC